MLTAVAGGYCHLGTVIGGQFYTEAISSSMHLSVKDPLDFFFALSSMNLVVWSIKALKNGSRVSPTGSCE